MVAATTTNNTNTNNGERPTLLTANGGPGSSRRLSSSSIRNLLLDMTSGIGGTSQAKLQVQAEGMNHQRRSSLKLMDVVPNANLPVNMNDNSSKSTSHINTSNLPMNDTSSKSSGGGGRRRMSLQEYQKHQFQMRRGSSVIFNRQGKAEVEKFFDSVITKPAKNLKESWGFSFNQIDNKLVITKIATSGLTDQQTDLQVGDIIWSINHVTVAHGDAAGECMSVHEARKLLVDPKVTTLLIRAKKPTLAQRTFVEATIMKQAKDDIFGFTVGKTFTGGKPDALIITHTHKGGLAVQQTDLRPGYVVLAINDVTTDGMSIDEVKEMLQQAEQNDDIISIRAAKPTLKSGDTLTETIQKDESGIGLVLRPVKENAGNKKGMIINVKHDSPAYHSRLEPNMIIEEINDQPINGAEIVRLLVDAPEGPIKIRVTVQ